MRGAETPDDKRIEFAAKYLVMGVAAAAARAVDLPERTGQDFAKELDADPAFAALRAERRARALQIALDGSLGLIELGVDRAHRFEPTETEHGYSDVAATYQRAVADLGRTVEKIERLRLEREGTVQTPGTVTVNVTPTPAAAARIESDGSSGA